MNKKELDNLESKLSIRTAWLIFFIIMFFSVIFFFCALENKIIKENKELKKQCSGEELRYYEDKRLFCQYYGGAYSSHGVNDECSFGKYPNDIYPEIKGNDWIEFDSMINLRPSMKNLSRGVDNPDIRKKIIEIVNRLIER